VGAVSPYVGLALVAVAPAQVPGRGHRCRSRFVRGPRPL